MVPSYNLPKLYEVIKDQMPEPQTLYSAYKEIIPAVIKKSKNPDYFIPVQVPNNYTILDTSLALVLSISLYGVKKFY